MHNISLIFGILGLLVFAFIYWRDATNEGFSSDKILDSYFVLVIGAILGGKLLFQGYSLDYFKYQIWYTPMILEGMLVGGGIAAYIVIKKNNWSAWKIGDMMAPGLSMFQSILFLGFWIRDRNVYSFFIFVSFIGLYFLIRYLKNKMALGTSKEFFQLKRLNKLVFTGGLLSVYLTGSSLIAILFLVAHLNFQSRFWRFQIVFYSFLFIISYFLINRRLKEEGLKMSALKRNIIKVTGNFQSRLKNILKKRKDQVEEEKKKLQEKDPFLQEAKTDGFRNIDELGDETLEIGQHKKIKAVEAELDQEEKEIEKTIQHIKEGSYGICEKCGKKIDKKRLKVYPTATMCVDCQSKIEK